MSLLGDERPPRRGGACPPALDEDGSTPGSVDLAWRSLYDIAPRFSSFERQAQLEEAALAERNVYNSGQSIVAATRLAHDHGYKWSQRRCRFVRRPTTYLGPGAALLGGISVTTASILFVLEDEGSVAKALTTAATTVAAFAALVNTLRPR